MSLSPSLLEMFANPMLIYRYERRLGRLIKLAEKELQRTEKNEQLHALAEWYKQKIVQVQDAFLYAFDKNLTKQFKKLQDEGRIEILGSTATHGYLPLLKFDDGAVQQQIRTGLNYYQSVFQTKANGMWLPECGYYTGLEKDLSENGIRYSILETHGITRAEPSPEYGVYEPVSIDDRVFFFGRDPDSSRLVWSADQGYPADPVYREFYRDIAYDLDCDSLYPFINSKELRFDSGFKYYKITGRTNQKEYYDPHEAMQKAQSHAGDFVRKKVQQIAKLQREMGRKPIITAPFDAELFGHWWGEGIEWLNSVIRIAAKIPEKISLVNMSAYLRDNPTAFHARPAPSSWGTDGYNKVWLNERNEWMYRHLHHGSQELTKCVRRHPAAQGSVKRALLQAARELALAQSSDWAFMIGCGTSMEYGKNRFTTHIMNLNRLLSSIAENEIDEKWLTMIESRNSIFRDLDYTVFSD
jgi:1,4-alpha-glucan branching enzyme